MRLARKLFLLTAMAITAIAITAGAANAQEEPVIVTDEVEHCDLNTGTKLSTCEQHVTGSSSLTLYIGGVPQGVISACNDEFLASLDEDGSGFIYHGSYENDAGPNPSCTRIQCNDAGEEDWPITNTGEYMESQTAEGHLDVRFCLDAFSDPGAAGTHCDAEIQVHNHGNHKYGYEADEVVCPIVTGVHVQLNGEWESEPTPHNSETEHETDIEIVH